MKNLSNRIKILLLIAVTSFLLLPVVAAADQEVELGTVVFRQGVDTKTLTLPIIAQTAEYITPQAQLTVQSSSGLNTPTLKSLKISVQNGTQRGKDRASSAVVNVNGEDLFTQKQFNQNVSSITTTTDVDDPGMQEVVLTTKVNGHKNVSLAVTVTAVYEEQELPMEWCLQDMNGNFTGDRVMGTTSTPPAYVPGGTWFPCF